MEEQDRVVSESGVEIEERAVATARGVLPAVREMAAELPFAAEPADFLVALERLAAEDGA
ncbi:hypothetical protein SH611_03520 [Geminicoccaceae bacterium 1502E]|nr:hypothetical protein [Geminicoccaceae bacterium 1502E]